MPSFDSSDLTHQQAEAINHQGSPLLIIAGPGSGKTEVIARRITRLVLTGQVKPENLLALTFTNKAAQGLKDRIQNKIPDVNIENMEVSTFHAFCAGLLRRYENSSPLKHGMSILDATGQFLFVYSRRKAFGLDEIIKGLPVQFYESVISAFNRATEEQVKPEKLEEWCLQNKQNCCNDDANLWKERAVVAEAYRRYCGMLIDEGRVDFPFLQIHALELLEQNPDIVNQLRRQYQTILVDEYQDTNAAQEKILQILAGNGRTLTVVGDDDQSIYRFRGATVKNILEFEKRYADVKVIRLTRNFRSYDQIVGQSQEVIRHNPARYEKDLLSHRGPGNEVLLVYEHTAAEEAGRVVDILQKLHVSGKIKKWSDTAILLRSVKSYSEKYRETLVSAGIPFQVSGDAGFFEREDIDQLCGLFHFLGASKPWGDKYLRCSIMDFDDQTNEALLDYKDNLVDIPSPEGLQEIGINHPDDRRRLSAMLGLKRRVQAQQHSSILEVFYSVLSISGLACRLEREGRTEALANLGIFSQLVAAWDENGASNNFYAFQEYLKLLKAGGLEPFHETLEDAVRIMTIHQSKGLEYPVVVLGAAMEGRLPSKKNKESYQVPYELRASGEPEVDDPHLVDERKLFYVAATRAQDLLIVGTADVVEKRGGGPSPFVFEMFGPDLKTAAAGSMEKVRKIESEKRKENEIRPRHSYSELAIFLECPVRYKFAHVYHLAFPRIEPVQYGLNIHYALQVIHERALSGVIPHEKDIPDIVDQTWMEPPPGRRGSGENLKQKAVATLQKYVRETREDLKRTARVETPFSFSVNSQVITGKIDLCRQAGNALELVDFKSSDPHPDAMGLFNFQMGLYGLGVETGLTSPVSHLTIQFLGNEFKTVSLEWDSRNREENKKRLVRILDDITANQFTANLAYCNHCKEYREICPYAPSGG